MPNTVNKLPQEDTAKVRQKEELKAFSLKGGDRKNIHCNFIPESKKIYNTEKE